MNQQQNSEPFSPLPSNRSLGFYQHPRDDGTCPACADGENEDFELEVARWGTYRADHDFGLYPHGISVVMYSDFDEEKYEWHCRNMEMVV